MVFFIDFNVLRFSLLYTIFIFYLDDIRLQCFKYVGAGLATISLAAQVLVLESFLARY